MRFVLLMCILWWQYGATVQLQTDTSDAVGILRASPQIRSVAASVPCKKLSHGRSFALAPDGDSIPGVLKIINCSRENAVDLIGYTQDSVSGQLNVFWKKIVPVAGYGKGPPYFSSLSVNYNSVFYQGDQTIFALDRKTGQERWRRSTNVSLADAGLSYSDVSVYIKSCGVLFVSIDTGTGSKFMGLDPASGAAIWTVSGSRHDRLIDHRSGSGLIYYSRWNGERTMLMCIRCTDGRTVWSIPAPQSSYAANLLAADEHALAITWKGQIAALSTTDGSQLWRTETNISISNSAYRSAVIITTQKRWTPIRHLIVFGGTTLAAFDMKNGEHRGQREQPYPRGMGLLRLYPGKNLADDVAFFGTNFISSYSARMLFRVESTFASRPSLNLIGVLPYFCGGWSCFQSSDGNVLVGTEDYLGIAINYVHPNVTIFKMWRR